MINLKSLIEKENKKKIKKGRDLQPDLFTFHEGQVYSVGNEIMIECPLCGFLNGLDRVTCSRCNRALGTIRMEE